MKDNAVTLSHVWADWLMEDCDKDHVPGHTVQRANCLECRREFQKMIEPHLTAQNGGENAEGQTIQPLSIQSMKMTAMQHADPKKWLLEQFGMSQ